MQFMKIYLYSEGNPRMHHNECSEKNKFSVVESRKMFITYNFKINWKLILELMLELL